MRETTKQTLAILVITAILSISLFIFLKFTQPTYTNLIDLKSLILEKQEIQKDLTEQKNTALEIVTEYQKSGEGFTRVRDMLPSEPQLAEILATLDAIARQTNVSLDDISFKESSPITSENKKDKTVPYQTIEVNFSIDGSFIDTNTFIAEVGKELRLMDIKNVSMNQYNTMIAQTGKTKGFKPTSALQTKVILHTYYQP